MGEWKNRLNNIITDYDRKREEEARKLAQHKTTVDEFLVEVVLPAFQALAAELERHGQETEISVSPKRSIIRVLPRYGEDEFTYGLEIRHGHVTPVTERVDSATGKPFVGESFIFGDVTRDRIEKLTQEDIINDFLEEFSRYLR